MNSKVAAIQMCSTTSVQSNLTQARELITRAVNNHAQLIVLPEMFALLGHNPSDKVAIAETYGQGPIQDFLASQAKNNNVWLVAGTIPLACDDPKRVRAASLVYDNQGNIRGRYDKMYLFDVTVQGHCFQESATTEPGDAVIVLPTPFGHIGLAVCYDLRFLKHVQALMERGAEILIAPGAFTKQTGQAHWELLARTRAIDTLSYFVGSCQGGEHDNGRTTYGHSMIVDPWGSKISESQANGQDIIYGQIDLDYLKRIRNQGFSRK